MASHILFAQDVPPTIHIVEPGNTLYGISKMYNISLDEIRAWNHLTSYSLKSGQQLIVSAPPKNNPLPEANADSLVQKKAAFQAPDSSKRQQKQIETIEDIGVNISEINEEEAISTHIKSAEKDSMSQRVLNNLIFCGGVENDKPVGVSSVFFSKKGQNYVYVFVEKDTAFGERQLIADLYIKNDTGEKTLLSSTNFSIKPRWNYTMFKHYIGDPGVYLIEVFDVARKKIGDGQVEILP